MAFPPQTHVAGRCSNARRRNFFRSLGAADALLAPGHAASCHRQRVILSMLSLWREWFVRGARFGFIERIRRHWNNPASHDRRIATGFLWVASFVFVGKLAGAAKEMAIAWRYGVSETVDAYVFVFNLVTWPVSLWFGVLTVVLVPLVIRERHESPERLKRFRAELLTLNLLLGLGALCLAYVALP